MAVFTSRFLNLFNSFMKKIDYLLLWAFVGLALVSCSGVKSYRTAEGGVWNTLYRITYNSDRDLQDSILAVMKRVEMSLSPFAEGSLVSRINAGEDVAADSLFIHVFTASQEINRLSGGVFDPTVAPLVNLWGFGYRKTGVEPSQEVIDSLLPLVGIASCHIGDDGKVTRLSEGTEFNFSAITKGYGCDLVGEMLRRNGVEDYMVEIGGEIAATGHSPRGTAWRVMVDAPVGTDTTVVHERLAVIEITDCGVATSGNYRNYRETAQGRVWHTVSPLTGHPAMTDLLSATVKAPTCMEADALATACMAMDCRPALSMIERLPHVEALLVTADTVVTTAGFPALQ